MAGQAHRTGFRGKADHSTAPRAREGEMSYLGVDNPFEMATPTPKQARPWTELAAHAARPARPGVAAEGKSAVVPNARLKNNSSRPHLANV